MSRSALNSGLLACAFLVSSAVLPAYGQQECTQPCASGRSPQAAEVEAHNRWLLDYAKLSPQRQQTLLTAATRVAEARRRALGRLIETDAEAAYDLSLSPVQRLGLPLSIIDLLETRIHTTGDLIQAYTESLPRDRNAAPRASSAVNAVPEPDYFEDGWVARIGGEIRRAFVYGVRSAHQSEYDTPIHAIALDDAIAVSESPLYRFDDLELLLLGFKPGQIVATSGGQPIVLPDLNAFVDLEQELLRRIFQFGPIYLPFNPNAWSSGRKRVLILKAMYRDDDREPPYDDSDIAAWFGGVQSFFRDNSQGSTTLDPLIVSAPLTVLDAATYSGVSSADVGHAILTDQTLAAARAEGLNPDDYDRVIILAPQLFDRPMARAEIGGRTVTVTGEKADLRVTLSHELGHTYGFAHSTFRRPSGADPLGPATSLEYGDRWDMMGAPGDDSFLLANPQRRHFNAFYKALAGWFLTPDVVDGTAGGDFRLYPHDSVDAVGPRAIFVEAGDGSTYWIGKRDQFPDNTSMFGGVEVRRVGNYPAGPYGPVELLDLDQGWTTGAPAGTTEYHSLAERNVFTDAANGMTIRVVFVGDDESGRRFARVFITRS